MDRYAKNEPAAIPITRKVAMSRPRRLRRIAEIAAE
jgi:hypothetical protein